jgi:IS5 family transposase
LSISIILFLAATLARLVRLDEVEHGIVSGYAVLDGNPADTNSFLPALDHHIASFGQAPDLATGDRGSFSAANERDAEARGVAKVALPARGPLSKTRAARQKQRRFRRALRWRAGYEANDQYVEASVLDDAGHDKGAQGFQGYVGWSVITKNLCAIARWQKGRTLKRRRRAAVG